MATKAILPQARNRLRPYQHSAVEAAISGIQASQPGLLVMPTGSGKSVVISEIVNRLDGKQILVITPRRSLLMQTRARLGVHGVLSSSLGNDLGDDHKVIAGTYQTMTRRPNLAEPDVIIIDECHLLPPDGSYAALVRRFPKAAVIGFTATPFRGRQHIKHCGLMWRQLYTVPMIELIDQGWLVRPVSMSTGQKSEVFCIGDGTIEAVTARVVLSLLASVKAENRKRCVVFCIDIDHATITAELLRRAGENPVYLVHSNMPPAAQDAAIAAFKTSRTRAWLVNVNLVSIGVDIPSVDAVAILRNVSSLALLIQMIGRGLRVWKEKQDCLVWDYGDGTRKFGFIDDPQLDAGRAGEAPVALRTCPKCNALLQASARSCFRCGHVLPRVMSLNDIASGSPLLSANYLAATYERASLAEDIRGIWIVQHHLVNGTDRFVSTTSARSQQEAVKSIRPNGATILVRRLTGQQVRMVSTPRSTQ
ncbi:DEAD/DEAH box helicase family protein [Acidovorax sp. NPDC077693]|uniref:DEAD/DEAH box helicase family protein n=1 Tax=unclassified Acidovorax TaxID=2684926 RepID=UPI0037C9985F